MPLVGAQERHQAFTEHHGSHRELLLDGSGTILGVPLTLARYNSATHYAELNSGGYDPRARVLGDVFETVEFAQDANGKTVQRNRLREVITLDGSNLINATTRVVLIHQAGQGYVKWTAFESVSGSSPAVTIREEKIKPSRASLTLEFRPSRDDDLRVGIAHFNATRLNSVILSQAGPKEARRIHMEKPI